MRHFVLEGLWEVNESLFQAMDISSYSRKESESNYILIHFIEFSNVYICDLCEFIAIRLLWDTRGRPCDWIGCSRTMANINYFPKIDLLALLKRISIERYFATFCRIFECAQ